MSDRAYPWFLWALCFVSVFAGLNVGTWVHGSLSGAWAGPASVASCGAVLLAVIAVGHVVTGQTARLRLAR